MEPVTPTKVKERWKKGVDATREQRNQAAVNHQFLRNKMWVYWNEGSNRLEEVRRHPDRVRASVPRVGPDSRRIMSKLMRRKLVFDVPPSSPDDSAIRGARIGEAALLQTALSQNWESVRLDHAYTAWEGGVAGICVEWDPKAGPPVGQGPDGTMLYQGDVRLSCVALHEMSFEPGTREGETARWWVRGVALPPPEVQARYGLENEPAADGRVLDSIHRMTSADASNTPLTMVYTYYERPSPENPQGMIATVVGEQFVTQDAWYFPNKDRLNVALAVIEPVHGHWYGHTPVTDAIGIQALYNASWSSIVEHMKNAGNARQWIPTGAVDDVEQLSDTPGENVEYNPINGERPFYSSPPSMPDWWIRQPAMLADAMDDVLSIHAVSRGDAPAGIESGIALSILSENDDTPVGMLAKNLSECWARAATLVLELYSRKVTETRRVTASPEPGQIPEVVEWTGEMLAGQTRVEVPLDSALPRNRAAQAAYAMQLHDRGFLSTPQQFAKVADLPDQDDLLAGIDPDTARAQRENFYMAAGRPRVVADYDDHGNHLAILRDFMRSERYENLPDDRKQIFRQHEQAHTLYAAQVAAQQLAAAGVSPIAAMLPSGEPSVLPPEMLANPAMLSQMAPGVPPPSPEAEDATEEASPTEEPE